MAKGKNKPTKTQAKSATNATSHSGWTIKSVGLAVVIAAAVAVIVAILKSEPPSGSRNVESTKNTSLAKGNALRHWQPEEESKAFAQYAGSKSCRECHQDQFDLWLGSDHQLAERLPEAGMDGMAFNPHREIKQPHQTSDISSKDGRFHIATRGYPAKGIL